MSDKGDLVVLFSADDVKTIIPKLSIEEAKEAFDQVAEQLSDRVIELGMETLEVLLHINGYPVYNDEEEEDEYTEDE